VIDYTCVKPAMLLVAVISLLLGSSISSATVYKWTDAQGKVHFSDKKIADAARLQSMDLGIMPPVKQVDSLPARPFTGEGLPRWLVVVEPKLGTSPELLSNAKLASFYFGGDCISPTSVDFAALKLQLEEYLPSVSALRHELTSVLSENRYRTEYRRSSIPRRDRENNEVYELSAELLDMKINACAADLQQSSFSTEYGKFSFHDFKKANAWIKVRWVLSRPLAENSRDSISLLVTVTEGSADAIKGRPAALAPIFLAAYRQALGNFVAQKNLAEVLQLAPPVLKTAPPPDNLHQPVGKLAALNNSVLQVFTSKAKLVQALTIVTPIRARLTEYYFERDEWPLDMADLGFDKRELYEPGLVEAVDVRLGGVLQIDLAASEFGTGRQVQFIPRFTMGSSLVWDCRTNLDKSLWIGECRGMD
jgi:hypothetical protein